MAKRKPKPRPGYKLGKTYAFYCADHDFLSEVRILGLNNNGNILLKVTNLYENGREVWATEQALNEPCDILLGEI